MGYTIKLLPVVHKDLRAAKKWYNDQKADLGEEFKLAVDKEIDYIVEFPEHYQRKYKELRQSFVNRFPYTIFYVVEEERNGLLFLGCCTPAVILKPSESVENNKQNLMISTSGTTIQRSFCLRVGLEIPN